MPDITPSAIEQYAESHTAPLPALLNELTEETKKQFGDRASMLSGPLVGQFLRTLVVASEARRVLEVGTFTGFSALMMAGALPEEGELITLDINTKHAQFARSYFARTEHGRKIKLVEGPALDSVRSLSGTFDLVFIDADKPNYINYYESVLPLLSNNGVVVADNVLWSGEVLNPKEDNAKAIAAFNDHVVNDPRVTQVMLPVRDGLLLISKALPKGGNR